VNACCVTSAFDMTSLTKTEMCHAKLLCVVEQHSKHADAEEAHHLELWRGNVTEMLKEMARRKQLTDLLVSFAPMASQRWVLCYVMLCYVMLCYVMLCYVMLCYVVLCCVVLCYVMLCYVMLCYVMLCYVMLCYVMLCFHSFIYLFVFLFLVNMTEFKCIYFMSDTTVIKYTFVSANVLALTIVYFIIAVSDVKYIHLYCHKTG